MAGNNLQFINTGLDHCYINGLPIVEAEIDISEVYKKVARISSLAVQADPWFNNHSNAQKLFSESHGEGDRITRDFLEEGARAILPVFIPYQRLIPEGAYDTTPVEYEFKDQQGDFSWTNPDPSSIFVNNIIVECTQGQSEITFVVDGNGLGTIELPDFTVEDPSYLAYDLAGFLGASSAAYHNYTENQNIRNNNIPQVIECLLSKTYSNFTYNIKICGSQYNAIGWKKALTEAGDVCLPTYKDDIRISHLIDSFNWCNANSVSVNGATIKRNVGSAYVTINDGEKRFLDGASVGEDFYRQDIDTISVLIEDASEDFNYDLAINTDIPKVIPSPRFEFDSNWNPNKIIYRYQNMDTRTDKLNYTSETLKDIRIDPNTFDHVLSYLNDSLKNYVLRELYLAVGYDKKAAEYISKYKQSRKDVKFWLGSQKGLQTQYTLAGV